MNELSRRQRQLESISGDPRAAQIEALRKARENTGPAVVDVEVVNKSLAAPVIVRQTPSFGFGNCRELGIFVKKTAKGMTYIDAETGRKKSLRFEVQCKYSGGRLMKAHTEVCGECYEAKKPNSCIHGRVGWCESCASS